MESSTSRARASPASLAPPPRAGRACRGTNRARRPRRAASAAPTSRRPARSTGRRGRWRGRRRAVARERPLVLRVHHVDEPPVRWAESEVPVPRCATTSRSASSGRPQAAAWRRATALMLSAWHRLLRSTPASPETRATGSSSSTETGSTMKAGQPCSSAIALAMGAPRFEACSPRRRVPGVREHGLVHEVGAARQGLEEAAPPHHRPERAAARPRRSRGTLATAPGARGELVRRSAGTARPRQSRGARASPPSAARRAPEEPELRRARARGSRRGRAGHAAVPRAAATAPERHEASLSSADSTRDGMSTGARAPREDVAHRPRASQVKALPSSVARLDGRTSSTSAWPAAGWRCPSPGPPRPRARCRAPPGRTRRSPELAPAASRHERARPRRYAASPRSPSRSRTGTPPAAAPPQPRKTRPRSRGWPASRRASAPRSRRRR